MTVFPASLISLQASKYPIYENTAPLTLEFSHWTCATTSPTQIMTAQRLHQTRRVSSNQARWIYSNGFKCLKIYNVVRNIIIPCPCRRGAFLGNYKHTVEFFLLQKNACNKNTILQLCVLFIIMYHNQAKGKTTFLADDPSLTAAEDSQHVPKL